MPHRRGAGRADTSLCLVKVAANAICCALTLPSTTGFTASKVGGIGDQAHVHIDTVELAVRLLVPRWYFTSPEPPTS